MTHTENPSCAIKKHSICSTDILTGFIGIIFVLVRIFLHDFPCNIQFQVVNYNSDVYIISSNFSMFHEAIDNSYSKKNGKNCRLSHV